MAFHAVIVALIARRHFSFAVPPVCLALFLSLALSGPMAPISSGWHTAVLFGVKGATVALACSATSPCPSSDT
ncbi:hypothetical protein PR001_g10131 [Phytophthora rubi]|uniref:Uncharacterized protein n=1 Tax=Phytophthora rubi TaxID=129364 RepID=A0A6A3MVS5_9STRA|nr:hypothetical protein PR002_g10219 [Phytophthora rubi]KAE9033502.1 hypothetical protein PR001_g10131 [Phytophthora rubi]